MKEIITFRKALKILGASMTEPYEHTNQDGTKEERNKLAFIQSRIMGGICYQLIKSMEYTQNETLDQASRRLERANRRNKNDELSLLEIERAQEWVLTLGTQLFEQEEMLKEALEAYDHATGEDYYAGRKQAKVPVSMNEAQKAAQAVLDHFSKAKKEEAA